ncbi:MAG TPA: CRISPR-associated endonuclease Cas1 [Thermoanaerobaculia bacterium]|nr:CRISPR-associated endonuclease Cas1 [Thermoanaerobaculia bacterium]
MDSTQPSVPIIPARMLNEFAYCPRLAYLEWVQGEWADNVETIEGSHTHRRVDRDADSVARIHDRSVHLTSESLGLTAVIDVIERDGARARPVDYKRGKKPAGAPGGVWEPEKVQLCAQGLLLREHGYRCNEGCIYFAASRERVRVRFTDALIARTEELLEQMRATLGTEEIPPPLEDSPKCPRCSLVSICLPEEVNALRGLRLGDEPLRPIAVTAPATYPLVVQDPRSKLRVRGDRFLVEQPDEPPVSIRVGETSHLVLMGGARCTMPALHRCLRDGLPIVHMSGSGWFLGVTRGMSHKNVELRAAQFAAGADSVLGLELARPVVAAKIRNARVLLRRNGEAPAEELGVLDSHAASALTAVDADTLLGLEGAAARLYYSRFTTMIGNGAEPSGFDFEGRNRRPPKDPVNALLSFVSALLLKDWTVALFTVGFDPLMGFYHRPRYGKPALALDMMEPFRPVIVDSVVIRALNNGEIDASDFLERLGGVLLKPTARRRLVAAYERRLAQEISHPIFGYRATYRRIFEIEARLLARRLLGEIPEYQPFRVR